MFAVEETRLAENGKFPEPQTWNSSAVYFCYKYLKRKLEFTTIVLVPLTIQLGALWKRKSPIHERYKWHPFILKNARVLAPPKNYNIKVRRNANQSHSNGCQPLTYSKNTSDTTLFM